MSSPDSAFKLAQKRAIEAEKHASFRKSVAATATESLSLLEFFRNKPNAATPKEETLMGTTFRGFETTFEHDDDRKKTVFIGLQTHHMPDWIATWANKSVVTIKIQRHSGSDLTLTDIYLLNFFDGHIELNEDSKKRNLYGTRDRDNNTLFQLTATLSLIRQQFRKTKMHRGKRVPQ